MIARLTTWTWLLLGTMAGPSAVWGQLTLLPEPQPQCVFGSRPADIRVVWRNPGEKSVKSHVTLKLYQTSSATVMPVSEKPWKQIQVLPGQTVIESAQVVFPAVKAETRFLVQWVQGTNTVLGSTFVLVYPELLLKGIKDELDNEALSVFDPNNQLKPLLKRAGVEFADLQAPGLIAPQGNVSVYGPFLSKSQTPPTLVAQARKSAEKGGIVVWIQPAPEEREDIRPSFYEVIEGKGTLLVVQDYLVSHLAQNPEAQLNMIQLIRTAIHPVRYQLTQSAP